MPNGNECQKVKHGKGIEIDIAGGMLILTGGEGVGGGGEHLLPKDKRIYKCPEVEEQ